MPQVKRQFAYFSMEIALESGIPTYAGGLGVLAGDTLRAAADLSIPLVAVTLLHRHGYIRQRLDPEGVQSEDIQTWIPEQHLTRCDSVVDVPLEGRRVQVTSWCYQVRGRGGFIVPVILLDSNLLDNTPFDRTLTDTLYGGDSYYRLCQELILGEGGIKMLQALGYSDLQSFHLNEGHAALAIPTLLTMPPAHGVQLNRRVIFTTHTPVKAGHDIFPAELASRVLGKDRWQTLQNLGQGEVLNMTDIALRGSHFINGVSMRHGEVSQRMFPEYPVQAITNGIHSKTWISPSFERLFDRFIPLWQKDPISLRYAARIPLDELWSAHQSNKVALLEFIQQSCEVALDLNRLTLGFARRSTAYKRALLLFHDIERLRALAQHSGGLQFVFAGKAHPHDHGGKELVKQIHQAAKLLNDSIKVVYLENYDMHACKKLVAGVDVWLNTPRPPLEASGTSGMKAALNGVPSASVLDGWWVEGFVQEHTGWRIGEDGWRTSDAAIAENTGSGGEPTTLGEDALDAESLYTALEHQIIPSYYLQRESFMQMMRHAISINASFFNTERMMSQYVNTAYAG